MKLPKKILNQFLVCFIFCITQTINIIAQPCSGSWATQLPLTVQCIIGQCIGCQNGGVNPAGCPSNPVYVGSQSNTFTFTEPVTTFFIDFRGFDGAVQCPRIEIKINSIFYPLAAANLVDIPSSLGCTGDFSILALTPDGYITIGAFSNGPSAQGRIIINNVNATSVTISTNDGYGTTFSNPFNCTTVPLKLESFNVKANSCKALLNWKTGIEQNVSNIEIQKSEDGIAFHKMVDITPKGSNSIYSFTTPQLADNYFRLKVIDLDGHYEYSETIFVKSACKEIPYVIVPNPASGNIEIIGLKKSDQLLIIDAQGKTLKQLNSPTNNKMDIQSIPAGIYILQVFSGNTQKASLKLIRH